MPRCATEKVARLQRGAAVQSWRNAGQTTSNTVRHAGHVFACVGVWSRRWLQAGCTIVDADIVYHPSHRMPPVHTHAHTRPCAHTCTPPPRPLTHTHHRDFRVDWQHPWSTLARSSTSAAYELPTSCTPVVDVLPNVLAHALHSCITTHHPPTHTHTAWRVLQLHNSPIRSGRNASAQQSLSTARARAHSSLSAPHEKQVHTASPRHHTTTPHVVAVLVVELTPPPHTHTQDLRLCNVPLAAGDQGRLLTATCCVCISAFLKAHLPCTPTSR